MRKLFIAALATLALTALGSATAADRAVSITRTGFVPADVTIAAGDTVTWRNTDTVQHQVSFNGTPCNLTIPAGASASCTFRAGGQFSYRDPSQRGSFRGTVNVTGARASVTIAARPKAASFAGPVALSGFVSSQAAGEPVRVEAQECGKTSATRVGAATSTAGGAWTLVVKP